jgi:UDP-N-acetylmuramoylalanine--D-glutamate ligase
VTTAERVLVYGLAVTGAATVRALRARGHDVVVADDRGSPAATSLADELAVDLVVAPDERAIVGLVDACATVVPAPGVPEDHPVVHTALARGRRVVTELELAYEWEQGRAGGPRPMLAVTGTDGKTTTTLLAVAMLAAGGCRSVAAGNTDVPLVAAVDLDVDAFVVECTSFRLAFTSAFRGDAAAWLNLAPDHLNWHRSLGSYIDAKARIFANQRPTDVAVGNVADEIVMERLARAPGRRVTFGASGADYFVAGTGRERVLTGPAGPLASVASMRRSLPHDLTNALAAAALVVETGLTGPDAVAEALGSFEGPPHRIQLVASVGGIDWYDDSKATTPHAASAAIDAFDRVVLIAGGRNKGLDLAKMATSPERIRALVAIGEAADAVATAFGPALTSRGAPILRASSMSEAVDVAGTAASPGDVVLLSPGCASFDWYSGFEARGDHFRREVERYLGGPRAATAEADR